MKREEKDSLTQKGQQYRIDFTSDYNKITIDYNKN